MTASSVVPLALGVVFATTMVVAMVWDLATFEIPDTLSLVLLATATLALLAGPGWAALAGHAAGALGAFAFGVAMFALGQWGGGDVKFLAAASLWLGWPLLIGYLVWVALAGGALGLLVLAFRRFTRPESWAARPWLARLHRAEQGLPYGVALGIGGLVMLRPAVAGLLAG
ncbi:MAG: prepilin peptidase [Rhodospirillaceae bacterium]